jgi:glycosyltransferase involved in cell wall biosynthesis
MVKLYKQEVAHQKQLADFEVVIANSDAVRLQLKSVGIEAETLHPFIDADLGAPRSSFRHEDRRSLGFLGRFEDYKGGATLLAALPRVVECSNVALRVTMSGDGSQREMWTRLAAEISARDSRISVDFTGWLAGDRIDEVFRSIDVLVIPSVWPEPFGLVGLEAARRGLPVVAFDVGGISEWLVDRENGQLVAGERCAADDLADAIVRCIKDVGHYSQLSTGAVRRRTAFSVDAHVRRLVGLLEGIQRT